MILEKLGDRLKQIRKSLGYTQKAIAEAIGSKLRSWQDYEAGKKVPGSQVIAGLSHLGINANWVLTGEGAIYIGGIDELDKTDHLHTYTSIPHHTRPGDADDLKAAAINLSLSIKWLKHKGLSPTDVVYIGMADDSMMPTILEGDLVIIDTRTNKLSGDGIYALIYGGTLSVKRIQIGVDGCLMIHSDNGIYGKQRIKPDDVASLCIIGRVIWVGGEL